MNLHFGCSGFHFNDWKGRFYPDNLPNSQWLSYYSKHFDTVEINNTFYKLPEKETFKKWYHETPDYFNFSVKGSRYITHMKKLKNVSDSIFEFYKSVSILEEKLACILWQLPPNFHRNDERLENFCRKLSGDFLNVIEFRHKSWFDKEVYKILEDYNVNFCIISTPTLPDITKVTSTVAYVRFHGLSEDWYTYLYKEDEIKTWADKLKQIQSEECFIYFNNDYKAHSIKNVRELQRIMIYS